MGGGVVDLGVVVRGVVDWGVVDLGVVKWGLGGSWLGE